jgi:hypothetical protein
MPVTIPSLRQLEPVADMTEHDGHRPEDPQASQAGQPAAQLWPGLGNGQGLGTAVIFREHRPSLLPGSITTF